SSRSSRPGGHGSDGIGPTRRSAVRADHPDVPAAPDVYAIGQDELHLEIAGRLALVQCERGAAVDGERDRALRRRLGLPDGAGAVGTRATGAGPECDEKNTTAAMPTMRIPAATPPAVHQRHRRSSAVHAVASAGASFPSSCWSACRTVLTMCLLRAAAADSRR